MPKLELNWKNNERILKLIKERKSQKRRKKK